MNHRERVVSDVVLCVKCVYSVHLFKWCFCKFSVTSIKKKYNNNNNNWIEWNEHKEYSFSYLHIFYCDRSSFGVVFDRIWSIARTANPNTEKIIKIRKKKSRETLIRNNNTTAAAAVAVAAAKKKTNILCEKWSTSYYTDFSVFVVFICCPSRVSGIPI